MYIRQTCLGLRGQQWEAAVRRGEPRYGEKQKEIKYESRRKFVYGNMYYIPSFLCVNTSQISFQKSGKSELETEEAISDHYPLR